MRFKLLYMAITVGIFAPAAQAQWTGKAEAGLLKSTGNAESTSANAKLDLVRDGTTWKNTMAAAALYGDNGSFTNAQRFEANYQADYKINDRLSWFGSVRGEKDRFSGFAYQATVSTGASYKFIDTAATKFSASLGAGYRRLREERLDKTDAGEVIGRTELETQGDPVATLSSAYEHQFNDHTKITDKFLAESGSNNTAIQNDVALQVSMTDTLALAVGYAIRYNSDPPALARGTDTLSTINLVYNIK